MDDLFDIANLITTVGVDAVKIKSEPGLPEKSSNEILTELFSTFDVEGTVSPETGDQRTTSANVKIEKEETLQTKKKKSKKKHKHKDKKHKKKSKHNSSDSNSDIENNGIKKKKKHKKKSKRKHESHSSKSSDSDEPKTKIRKLKNNISDVLEEKGHEEKFKEMLIKREPISGDKTLNSLEERNCKSPDLPPISKKVDGESEDTIIPKLIERPKQTSQVKIQIKDLKNSVVYNETVKQVESKEKAKAARMEDGELTDSSTENNRTPTLSPTPPPRGSYRSMSPSSKRSSLTCKNDLRLILREKEKKKLENYEKSKAYDKDHRDGKHKEHNYKSTRSSDGKRSRSCHSQDRKRSDSQRRSRSRGRERQRGRSKDRCSGERSVDRRESARSRERRRHRSRSDERSRDKYTRGRSRSRERKERIEIDKKKLLEIARRNAINMIKQGTLPLAQQDKAIAAIQAGGKTVDELTDFCKSLSKSEALGELSSISSDEDGSESEKGFHHPFLLKERPSSIIMNIRDAKQLPTKTFQEKTAESSTQLRLQFPVSSGQHHRKSENEWVPVTPKKPEAKKAFVPATTLTEPLAIMPPPPVSVQAPVQSSVQPPLQTIVQPPVQNIVQPAVQGIVQSPIQGIQPPVQNSVQTTVFPSPPTTEPIDIGTIVSQRLAAMRKLRENPNDVCALNQMYRAQNEMKTWAESKQMPGQFTGSTGAKVLTPAELSSGYQAWARKDQLVSAQPVSGGMGMALLQKMGWRPGEGLGKNKEGTLEPLQLEVKLDKRGLVSEQDIGATQKIGKATKPLVPTIKTLEGKHPVSLLGEYCSKRKIGAPVYELCFECGPDHKKNFLFKVRVNGVEYKPSVASPNKKQAKAEAAQICLQTLGLLPS